MGMVVLALVAAAAGGAILPLVAAAGGAGMDIMVLGDWGGQTAAPYWVDTQVENTAGMDACVLRSVLASHLLSKTVISVRPRRKSAPGLLFCLGLEGASFSADGRA